MKQARWKNILRNIKENLNRFLSILFIVALGAGFMAGLAAASPDMYEEADRYIRKYHLFDLDIKSVIGLEKDSAETLASLKETAQVQGAYVFDMVLNQESGSDFTSRVYGILDEDGNTAINQFQLVEGRLPQTANECVIESVFGRYSGEAVNIGDHLFLAEGTPDYERLSGYLSVPELTVVGIAQSPMCISIEGDATNIGSGTINLNVYVKESLFSCDFYTDLFVTLHGSESFNSFEDAYAEFVASTADTMRPVGDALLKDRIQNVESQSDNQLDLARRVVNHFQDVLSVKRQMQADVTERSTLHQQVLNVLSGQNPGTSFSYLEQERELFLEDEKYDPLSGRIASLEDQIREGEEQIGALSDAVLLYRTRHDLAGFDSYYNNVGKVSALAKIFPVFFFIVALLVALTTMSRLIEENRLQIGTLKALGYTNGQILFEYLLFSFAASVLGSIVGFVIGFRIFPLAISSAYGLMYTLPTIHTPLRWEIIAWVAPVTILSIICAALWSCWNSFRSLPATLMLPKAPSPGKRIWLEHLPFLWKHFSFNYKVTFRNLFRYKKRFIMTIIGVAGCSALLLTGFGIRDSVNDIVDKQFGEIYRYNMLFALDKPESLSKDPELNRILHDPEIIASFLPVCQESGKIYAGKDSQDLSLFVPSEEALFPEFITLRSRVSKESFSLSEEGVILTEKMCEEMHIKAGDTVTLEDSAGHQSDVLVLAITENYVSSFAYLTETAYHALFHTWPSYNSLVCISAPDISQTDITTEILSNPHVLYGRSVDSLKETFSDSIASINGVVYVLILAAALLCIVVLYNLTNVNICERRKELATLKVLGFHKSETQSYIFRETNILSFLGALVGLVIGIWLHGFVVRTVEVNHVMFGREIKPLSFLIALAISVVFTLLVDLIMIRPINKTDMVEAMKAND